MRWRFGMIAIIAVLMGCSQNVETMNEMPDTMPEDFAFKLEYGVGKNNVVNTFEGTVTKDLIGDGTASTELAFNQEELSAIYEMMKETNIFEEKSFIPQPTSGVTCQKEPFEEDEWEIFMNGETITHSISGTYCEPTDDMMEMLELRQLVWEIVKAKPVYQELPEANGAYE